MQPKIGREKRFIIFRALVDCQNSGVTQDAENKPHSQTSNNWSENVRQHKVSPEELQRCHIDSAGISVITLFSTGDQ